jgi:hypothetical protein
VNSVVTQPSFDPTSRRAGIRRTVWITAGIAFLIFVGFVVQQFAR